MTPISFKNACAAFVALVFTLTVASSEVHAQSQASVEKANTISNVLLVSALVLATVVVIVTVTKGDKKDAGKEGEQQKKPEKQEDEQKPEGQAWIEPSLLSDQAVVFETYETGQVNSIPDSLTFSLVENAGGQQHLGCWGLAYEME